MKRIIVAAALAALVCLGAQAKVNVKGKVSLDGKPAAGVLVSDGTTIVKTDAKGRYALESSKKDSIVFITVPSGAVSVKKDGFRPDFWAWLTKDANKVEKHDFSLVSENQDSYSAVFLPDIHLSNDPRRDDINRFRNEVFPFLQKKIAEASKNGPVYMMNLGDFTHEIYWYEFDFDEEDGVNLLNELGFSTTTYSITGNHDHDGGIVGPETDFRAAWLYRKMWGPDRYSVNIGKDHWVFLDDIYYINVEGQGKKAPGIKGDRSYADSLTRSQMDWLAKDLSYVPDEAHVYICTHAPFFTGVKKGAAVLPNEQMDEVNRLCARFNGKTINFAGHIHKFDFLDSPDYEHLKQYGMPCASGIMWETKQDMPLVCSDGSEAGLYTATSTNGAALELSYETYRHGPQFYRIYDMNSVGAYYRASEGIAKQRELAPTRANYGAPEFENCVFVNYWAWEEGHTVEMYENGKALKVVNKRHEDPVKNFAYDIERILSPVAHHSVRPKDACNHMFEAKASSATSDVVVIIKDKDGKVLFQETVKRPKAFSLSLDEEVLSELSEKPERIAGNMNAYERLDTSRTAVPDGYKPFYISHFGRHGSRYDDEPDRFNDILEKLQPFYDNGGLTEDGIALYKHILAMREASEGHYGELSALGAREQREIAGRMGRDFPEVFSNPERNRVVTISTSSPRVLASRENFLNVFRAEHPALNVEEYCGGEWKPRVSGVSSPKRPKDTGRIVHSYGPDNVSVERLLKKTFVHPEELKGREAEMKNMFCSAAITASKATLIGLSSEIVSEYFTTEEIYDFWYKSNPYFVFMWGICAENDTLSYKYKGAEILKHIVEDADAAVAGNDVAADLRFSHDVFALSLWSGMGLEDCGSWGPYDEQNRYFKAYATITPACNSQMIFYRNAEGKVLVKILLNEREVKVPALDDATAPYYDWTRLRAYLLDRVVQK